MSGLNKRALGDLRIFQAVYNDLSAAGILEHDLNNSSYKYTTDPYNLEDDHFPTLLKYLRDTDHSTDLDKKLEEIVSVINDAATGNDPFPGRIIIESPSLPITKQPKKHPFLAFIKGRAS